MLSRTSPLTFANVKANQDKYTSLPKQWATNNWENDDVSTAPGSPCSYIESIAPSSPSSTYISTLLPNVPRHLTESFTPDNFLQQDDPKYVPFSYAYLDVGQTIPEEGLADCTLADLWYKSDCDSEYSDDCEMGPVSAFRRRFWAPRSNKLRDVDLDADYSPTRKNDVVNFLRFDHRKSSIYRKCLLYARLAFCIVSLGSIIFSAGVFVSHGGVHRLWHVVLGIVGLFGALKMSHVYMKKYGFVLVVSYLISIVTDKWNDPLNYEDGVLLSDVTILAFSLELLGIYIAVCRCRCPVKRVMNGIEYYGGV